MSNIAAIAAARTPPRSGADMTGRIEVTTARADFTVPAEWKGNYVKLRANGGVAHVLFGKTATETAGLTADNEDGWRIADGESEEWLIGESDVLLAHIGSGALDLEYHVCSGKVGA
jgi:hypothetical protein